MASCLAALVVVAYGWSRDQREHRTGPEARHDNRNSAPAAVEMRARIAHEDIQSREQGRALKKWANNFRRIIAAETCT